MTRQVKSTSLKNKISRAVKKTALFSVLLCYILSIVIHAQTDYIERTYDARKVNYIRFYGYDSELTDQVWRSYSIIRDGNTGFHTRDAVVYGQYGNRIEFMITKEPVRQIDYNYKIYAKNSSIGSFTKALYVNYISTNNQKGIPTVIETGNTKTIENEVYKEYNVLGSHNFESIEVNQIFIQTNIQFVSSPLYVEDFVVVINNETEYYVGELKDVNQSLEDYASQMTVPIPDVNDVVDIIDGNIPQIDTSYKDAILLFTSHYIIIEILVVVIALALLSYIVYGRKT